MNRKIIPILAAFVTLFPRINYAQVAAPTAGTATPPAVNPLRTPELLAGPERPADFPKWLAEKKKWREDQIATLKFDAAEYNRPEFSWVAKNIIHTQMMIEDRYFYDPVSGKYTVDRYLDDLTKRFGGIQSVLIWPSYPNIGIDNRNQYDMIADMPGGIPGVKQMVADFKRRGVRVLFPIMFWDYGTRDAGATMPENLSKLMLEIGADGLNGDTMPGVGEDYKTSYIQTKYPLVLEPELGMKNLKMVEWNTMSWGYWTYGAIPGISMYKWLEPRHMVHVNRRWGTDKTDDLQYAFFNGVGYTAWENVWGIWNEIPELHAESIRRTTKILRQFSDVLSSSAWEPHTPVLQGTVFASKFPGAKQTLWTLINKSDNLAKGRQIALPYQPDTKYYDVWNGTELNPERDGDKVYLSFDIEHQGYGAIVSTTETATNADFQPFLNEMNAAAKVKLASLSKTWRPIQQKIVDIQATKRADKAPKEMVLVPAIKYYSFESTGVYIEGDALPSASGIQYPGESTPGRSHKKSIDINAFYIDRHPVTNAEFKKFMDASKYQPKEKHNFLKDWVNGSFPKGWDNKPVTWVSLTDARAYASWAGKRLPHEWEWQYAAQGKDGRTYPWGDTADSTQVPTIHKDRNMAPPDDINKFPKAASPFGVTDLVGNVWQWTDEYADEHTRFAVLKGGSNYKAQGSRWYFPQAYEVNKYGKYLLMYDGRDRSARIGFRCVTDAE
jgi:formylglycine-generating enzyme required for sulfatase activity